MNNNSKAPARFRKSMTLALAVTAFALTPITTANAAPLDKPSEMLIQQAEAPHATTTRDRTPIVVEGDEATQRYVEASSYTGSIKKVSLGDEGRAAFAAQGVTFDDARAMAESNEVAAELAVSDPLRAKLFGMERNPRGGKSLALGFDVDPARADISALTDTGSNPEDVVITVRTSWNDQGTSTGVPNLTKRSLAHKVTAQPGVVRDADNVRFTNQQEALDFVNYPEVTSENTSSFYEGRAGDPGNAEVSGTFDSTGIQTWFTDFYKGSAAVSDQRLADITLDGMIRGHNPETLVDNSSAGDTLGGYAVVEAVDLRLNRAVDLTGVAEIIVASDYGVPGLDKILAHNSPETAKVVNKEGARVHMVPRAMDAELDQAFWDNTSVFYPGYSKAEAQKEFADAGILGWPTADRAEDGQVVVLFPGVYSANGEVTTAEVIAPGVVQFTKSGAARWIEAPDAETWQWTELSEFSQPQTFLDGKRYAFDVVSIEGDKVTLKSQDPDVVVGVGGAGIGVTNEIVIRSFDSFQARGYEAVYTAPALSETPEPPVTETPQPPVETTPPPVVETPEPPVTETPTPPVETTPPPVVEQPPVTETPEPTPPVETTPPPAVEVPPVTDTPTTPPTDTPETPVVPETPVDAPDVPETPVDAPEVPVDEVPEVPVDEVPVEDGDTSTDEVVAVEDGDSDGITAALLEDSLADTGASKGGLMAALGALLAGAGALLLGRRRGRKDRTDS